MIYIHIKSKVTLQGDRKKNKTQKTLQWPELSNSHVIIYNTICPCKRIFIAGTMKCSYLISEIIWIISL